MIGQVLVFLFLVGIFVGAVYWFRSGKIEAASRQGKTDFEFGDADRFTPTSVLWAAASLDRETPTASLHGINGSNATGTVRRLWKDGRYSVDVETSIVNTSIDRSLFAYEAWLIRPVPYDFLSIGDMVSNEVGFFVTQWQGGAGQDLRDYTQVLITKEAKDGNPEPGEKIMEGEFGK